jgi:predicted ABC-type transport system involved in lysophospholipase L1 biosynthesis ATPase subunit
MSESGILRLTDVVVAPGAWSAMGLSCASLQVEATDLVAVGGVHPGDDSALLAVATGLCAPDAGVVQFLGEDWTDMSLFRQCERRGLIGRVFEVDGWISNLTVYENVALSQRHHTRRAEDDIRAEALARARQVGLDLLLDKRPALLRRNELKRAQWVRAFMGQPRMVLLEQPLAELAAGESGVLFDWVDQATARGCPVVWVADDEELKNPRLARARRVDERDGKIVPGGQP